MFFIPPPSIVALKQSGKKDIFKKMFVWYVKKIRTFVVEPKGLMYVALH